MGEIREGRWDCVECNKANLGRNLKCESCGEPRRKGVTFYLPEDAPVVTNPELLRIARAGADWYCANCDAGVRRDVKICPNCGDQNIKIISFEELQRRRRERATRLDSSFYNEEEPSDDDDPFGELDFDAAKEFVDEEEDDGHSSVLDFFTDEPGEGPDEFDRTLESVEDFVVNNSRTIVIVFTFITLVLGALYFFFASHEIDARITHHSWERNIEIEAYRTVVDEGWYVPAGGRELSIRSEIRSYNSVLSHYETKTRQVSQQVASGSEEYACGSRDLGNGFFETEYCSRTTYTTEYRTETYQDPVYVQEPVYDWYYTYEIERWVHDRTRRSKGEGLDPYWPEYTLNGWNERKGRSTETYYIHFENLDPEDEHPKPYKTEITTWRSLRDNQVLRLKVNKLGSVVEILE